MKTKIRPICLNCGIRCSDMRNIYCSVKCQKDVIHKTYIKNWLDGLESGNSGEEGISEHVRRYFFEKFNSKCSKCFWGKPNPITGKVPLTLNHIDGNYKNSIPSNLELLCPNCHSLTENYGSLNRGHGRKQRRLKLKFV